MAPNAASTKFICPIDKRVFKSKKALEQHKSDSHVVARSSRPKPRGNGNARRSQLGAASNSRRVSGTDIIGTFVVLGSMSSGTVVAGGTIFPSFWEGTRAYAEAQLWARWRPKTLVLDVLSSAGAMTSGSFVSGWTMDPDLWLSNGDGAIRMVASFKPSNQTHISKSIVLRIPCETTQRWYTMDSNADLIDKSHGKWLIVLASTVGNISGSSNFSFTVRLRYDLEFNTPLLPLTATPGDQKTVYVDPGYESYFTDSDSGWADGKYCTLKHAAGGSMCEFTGLLDGTIYKLDQSAKLAWFNASGSSEYIRYLCKIIGQEKHVIVFTNIDQARMYLRTKDPARGLAYSKTGLAVVPSNPAWFEEEKVGVQQDRLEYLETRVAKLTEVLNLMAMPNSSIAVEDKPLTKISNLTAWKTASIYTRFQDVSEVEFGKGVVNVAGLVDGNNSQAQDEGEYSDTSSFEVAAYSSSEK